MPGEIRTTPEERQQIAQQMIEVAQQQAQMQMEQGGEEQPPLQEAVG